MQSQSDAKQDDQGEHKHRPHQVKPTIRRMLRKRKGKDERS